MKKVSKPKIYSYVRFSTDIQIKGDSLTRQRESIVKYSQSKGYELDESLRYEDKGVSAYTSKNIKEGGKLYAFLEEIQKGNVPKGSILLVEALDRLSRAEPSQFLKLFIEILDEGITIVTTKDGGEYSKESFNSDYSKLICSIVMMVQANSESKQKSWRLKEAWERKRQNIGEKFYSSRCPSWLNPIPKENRFELIPEKSDTVKRMFQMVLEGDHCEGISRQFIKEGVAVVGRRKLWSASYVSQTLRNLSVTGKFQPHRMINGKRTPEGDVIEDYYPRIVSDDDYVKVNAIMDSRQKNGKSGRISEQNLFRGVLFCGYCGAPAYRTKKGGDKYRSHGSTVYVCSKAKEGNGCLYYAWNAKEFESDFLTHAKELQVSMFSSDVVRDTIQKRDVVELDLRETVKRLDNIADAIADGIGVGSVKRKLEELEMRKSSLDAQLEKLEKEVLRVKSPIATLDEMKSYLEKMEDPVNRKRAANVISAIYGKIFLFFGGSRFTFAKITSETKRLARENPNNLNRVSALIRDKFDRKKNRFFVARISGGGINGRTCFPVNAVTPDELYDIEPDDGEMELIDANAGGGEVIGLN